MKHTPGPWKFDSRAHVEAILSDSTDVCFLPHSGSTTARDKDLQEIRANARLIAAAPELLEACEMMLRLAEGETLDEAFPGEIDILRDAINRTR